MVASKNLTCPCGGAALASCCGPYLQGDVVASSAEQLMRSRYSAYVLRREDYLLASWHASTRPAPPLFDESADSTKWLGLEVRAAQHNADTAMVEFVARCRIDGRGQRLHEVSRFVCEDGRWFYVDGSFPEK